MMESDGDTDQDMPELLPWNRELEQKMNKDNEAKIYPTDRTIKTKELSYYKKAKTNRAGKILYIKVCF